MPGDLLGLKPGRQRYTLLTNEAGGIIDDLMVANLGEDRLFLVVNASRKDDDFTHIAANLPAGVQLDPHDDRALLALQGPAAAAVIARIGAGRRRAAVHGRRRRHARRHRRAWSRAPATPARTGSRSRSPPTAPRRWRSACWPNPRWRRPGSARAIRCGWRPGSASTATTSTRLTTPVEAGLTWVIGKRRRTAWDFPGAAAIRDQFEHGAHRHRVGIRPDGRAPARAQTDIVASDGTAAGTITSGGFAPTLSAPIAMGYVRKDLAADGTALQLIVRGKPLPARVVPMPFVPHRYVR